MVADRKKYPLGGGSIPNTKPKTFFTFFWNAKSKKLELKWIFSAVILIFSKSLQLPNTARHSSPCRRLPWRRPPQPASWPAGTISQARIARSPTYVLCQGGYNSCRPSRCFHIWWISGQLWGRVDSKEGGKEEEAKDKKEVEDASCVRTTRWWRTMRWRRWSMRPLLTTTWDRPFNLMFIWHISKAVVKRKIQ